VLFNSLSEHAQYVLIIRISLRYSTAASHVN
jgi:hypothetical protein